VPYSELAMPQGPKAKLKIVPGHIMGTDFDVDWFGQDDGSSRDPNDSFRLILQLGIGYYIYLLVVGMAQPDGRGRFTKFWVKDCAVVEIEMEEYDAPSLVEGGPFEVPVNFAGVTLWRGETETARFGVTGCAFEAKTTMPDPPVLTMRWRLSDEGLLWWTSDGGWSILTRNGTRVLEAGEYVTFVDELTT
jgi:hypothetical protein